MTCLSTPILDARKSLSITLFCHFRLLIEFVFKMAASSWMLTIVVLPLLVTNDSIQFE